MKWLVAGLSLLAMVDAGAVHATPPRLVVHWEQYDPYSCGGWGDGATLTIFRDGKKPLNHAFCAAYGNGKAELATDTRGRLYLVTAYSWSRGTNAQTYRLQIFSVGEVLRDRGTFEYGRQIWPDGLWKYSYRVSRPAGGGLSVAMTLHVDPSSEKPEKGEVPQARTRRLVLDVAHGTPGEPVFTKDVPVVEPRRMPDPPG